MSTETNIAKQAVHDRIDSQVKSVQARLETLKARAEAATAAAATIADLFVKMRLIDRTLSDLKKSGEGRYQQAKADIESRVAELEKSVQAIEAKFKAA
jgi:prefoldin subunit 5